MPAIPVLRDKHIVLGVAGSIAAYKAVDLASKLTQAGALVDVILTESAREFVTPLSFQAITHRRVVTDLFALDSEMAVEHVGLALRADCILIAPATAHLLAKLALGLADDALGCTVLATQAPVIVAPAMDAHMYSHPATVQHVATLRERGVRIIEPGEGYLASGLVGRGRLAEPTEIVQVVRSVLGRSGDLAGRRIVVTAGGTREPVDPVRYVGNRSSGKMGFAIAEAARDRGARVTLIHGPVSLPRLVDVEQVPVETASEMAEAVHAATATADALIMAAAVADFRPLEPAAQKIKKRSQSDEPLTLTLGRTVDILASIEGDLVRIGFAAETSDVIAHAQHKLAEKRLDLIVANDVTEAGSGFGTDTNRVTLISATGIDPLPLLSKQEVADRILDRLAALLAERPRSNAGDAH